MEAFFEWLRAHPSAQTGGVLLLLCVTSAALASEVWRWFRDIHRELSGEKRPVKPRTREDR